MTGAHGEQDVATDGTAAAGARSRRTLVGRVVGELSLWSPRTVFWASFVGFLALTGAWSVASPLSSGPDEPTHLTKAAAVVRGQFIGHQERPGYFIVQLPSLYDAIDELPACYNFTPAIPASCSNLPRGELSAEAPSDHTAGSYNPVYYAVVGIVTLGPDRVSILYATRVASAMLVSLALALAMRSAAETTRPGWALAGTFLGVTPMVAFLGGVVNPNSIEVAAGLGLWATLGVVVLAPRDDLLARRMLRAGVLVVLLANAKPLSLLMLAVVVLACVAAAPWRRTWAVLRDRRAWPGLALGTVGVALALAWLAWVRRLASAPEVLHPELTPPVAAEIVLRETSDYLTNMLGQFGWVDTDLPVWLYVLLGGTVLVALLLAAAVGDRRQRAVLAGTAALLVALPLVLQVPTATVSGIPWQGRYLLAIAVGLPVLAGLVVATRAPAGADGVLRPLAALCTGIWAAGHVLAFGLALRRYMVGISHPYFEVAGSPWRPPYVPWQSLFALCVLGACVLAVVVVRAGRTTRDVPDAPGTSA